MFAMGAGLIISDFFVVLQDAISAVHSLVLVSMQPHSFRANKGPPSEVHMSPYDAINKLDTARLHGILGLRRCERPRDMFMDLGIWDYMGDTL
jgi:hypothetical protein